MSERLSDLRVVFIGIGSAFSAASLRAVAWNCKLVGVVESVDQYFTELNDPTNTYRSGMRRFARHRRIPWALIARKGPRLVEFLQRMRPDIICVAGMIQLLRPEEWNVAPLGAINLHPALLPKFRGPNPMFWQFHDMDLIGGVTIHKIDKGIDTGDILTQSRFPIPLGCSPSDYFHRSSLAGANALVRALSLLQSGTARPRPQGHLPCPRYARTIEKQEQFINYETWPRERIWHFLRGTYFETRCLPVPDGSVGVWRIGAFRSGLGSRQVGAIHHDANGYHLGLRDGSIDLQFAHRTLPRRVLHAVGRRVEHFGRWW